MTNYEKRESIGNIWSKLVYTIYLFRNQRQVMTTKRVFYCCFEQMFVALESFTQTKDLQPNNKVFVNMEILPSLIEGFNGNLFLLME